MLSSLGKFSQILKNFLGLLMSSIVLLYLLGYLRTKAYFFVFDSDWLMKEIGLETYIENSILPVLVLVLMFLLCMLGYVYGMLDQNKAKILIIIAFSVTTLLLMFGYYYIIKGEFSASFSLLVISSIGAASLGAILIFVVALFNETISERAALLIFIFIIVYGIVLSPISIGYAQGHRDRIEGSTKLPMLDYRGASSNYRVLYHKNDIFYLVNLYEKDHKDQIIILQLDPGNEVILKTVK